ncbi:uncharacterized protein FOMMEDRAFT_131573 [Fomitiporia mediterranea MF3/22]|uniref:uncharacterized protein n=1 Tax=Fomitiporia mediterranea (strain MF3/22) TaxID=694068 RepID=UPI00044092E9|nr:uncharacterized protein FOMMEDRAFT_131573 [Fomitiporia mediterranea MF3/22]EJD06721.1 hypothetical protein FOMMEDRAFT_131573 [Fomitiporia mediterranea MF3/22]
MGTGSDTFPRGLESLTPELLSQIALFTICDRFKAGPPSQLLPLSLISRSIYRALCLNDNYPLLSQVFGLKFDLSSCGRRFGVNYLTTVDFSVELKKRCQALKRLRAGCFDDTTLVDDLWTALLMMFENDGFNEVHLLDWVGLHSRLLDILRKLHAQTSAYNSSVWSLTIWLLWMTSDEASLRAEVPFDRDLLMSALQPLVIAGNRHEAFCAPEASFECRKLHLLTTKCMPIIHYNQSLFLRIPSAPLAAFLASTARLDFDQQCGKVVGGCSLSLPRSREVAIALGITGPTIEDMEELGKIARVAIRRRASTTGSTREHNLDDSPSKFLDIDWSRMMLFEHSSQTARHGEAFRGQAYVPGNLAGPWAGKFMVPELQAYRALLADSADFPSSRIPMYQRPLYMRLREHHCLSAEASISYNSDRGEDFLNAWLPRSCSYREDEDSAQLVVYDKLSRRRVKYHTLVPVSGFRDTPGYSDHRLNGSDSKHHSMGYRNVHAEGFGTPEHVKDIIVTGETDPQHGDAWGHFKVLGRVRPWDGLVALLRSPAFSDESELGTWLFRGYIVGSGMLVGRWRDATSMNGASELEGPFFMTKQ